MKKIPIDENGDGNCCPKCGSIKISRHDQCPIYVEVDLNSGKEIFRNNEGKRIYNPSNKMLAMLYRVAQIETQCWLYKCRKCGWESEMFIS